MSLENLIKNLETEDYSKKNSCDDSISLIKKLFFKIKNKDEFYNLFLTELEIDFINYYKNIQKDRFNKKKSTEIHKDNLAKNKSVIAYSFYIQLDIINNYTQDIETIDQYSLANCYF